MYVFSVLCYNFIRREYYRGLIFLIFLFSIDTPGELLPAPFTLLLLSIHAVMLARKCVAAACQYVFAFGRFECVCNKLHLFPVFAFFDLFCDGGGNLVCT